MEKSSWNPDCHCREISPEFFAIFYSLSKRTVKFLLEVVREAEWEGQHVLLQEKSFWNSGRTVDGGKITIFDG